MCKRKSKEFHQIFCHKLSGSFTQNLYTTTGTQNGSFVMNTINDVKVTKSENGSHMMTKPFISQGTKMKIPGIDSFQNRIIEETANTASLVGDTSATDGTDFMEKFILRCYIVSPLFMGKTLIYP